MDPDDRTFMRELLLRHKKATDAMIARCARLDEGLDQTLRENRELLRHAEQSRREHADFMDEQRAQRKAMWRVFDLLYGELDA